MTITIGAWIFPLIITIVLLVVMYNNTVSDGPYDLGPLLALFWVVPILISWLIYFMIY